MVGTPVLYVLRFFNMEKKMPKSKFYRNNISFSYENEIIDEDSLFERKENSTNLILVDDDYYIEVEFSDSIFYEVPKPDELD